LLTAEELQRRIDRLPRARIANLPTPLEKMPRLTSALKGPQLWIKRDDCTGLAFGGNKERKAEFSLGDAISKKADVVITVGPLQSNHSRATAAAATKLGLKVVLVITGEKPSSYDGNLLLNNLLGAEIRFLGGKPSKQAKTRFMEEIAAELKRKGHVPYVVPAGASYPQGAIAYVNAMLELLTQARKNGFEVDTLVHAAGSGGTQAGLVLANKALGSKVRVLGICAEPHSKEHLAKETLEIAGAAAKLLNLNVTVKEEDVVLSEDYAGKAYEIPPPEALNAIKIAAQTEGIVLDPIYTGRAMAGLIDLINQHHFNKGDNVIFLHTGGTPALFPYKEYFQPA
jgi:D-cysteine desulfhydrase family pyridoxal phosphate-dependent enzyme